MNRWKYALVGLLVGAFAFPLVWNSDPLVIGQTVTVDSTQSPLVVNAAADLADLTPTDGQSVIIKTGTEKGLWYYDKDSSTATSVSVLNGPGSVGRFLVINNDAGSVAAATAITAAEITDDSLLELQAFDGSSAKSLTLEELKKTGVQVINVVQEGADPTGVASSTTAFENAITAGNSLGKVVYIPPGTYNLTNWTIGRAESTSLRIVGDNCKLIGPGIDSDIFFIRHNTGDLSISGCEFEDWQQVVFLGEATLGKLHFLNNDVHDCVGAIDGNGTEDVFDEIRIESNRVTAMSTATAGTGCVGFRIRAYVPFASVRNNFIDGITATTGVAIGIQLADGVNPPVSRTNGLYSIEDNHIEDVTSGAGSETHGIIILGYNVHVKGNFIVDISNTDNADNEGIYVKADQAVISGNTLIDAGGLDGCITYKGGTGARIVGNTVTHTSTTLAVVGIRSFVGHTNISDNFVHGCRVGIEVGLEADSGEGTIGYVIHGNTIGNVPSQNGNIFGIRADCTVSNVSIKNNTIHDLTASTAGNYCWGISLSNDATETSSIVTVEGNIIRDLSAVSTSRIAGIKFENLATCNVLKIASNVMDGMYYGISIDNTGGTLNYLHVDSNKYFNINGSGANYSLTGNAAANKYFVAPSSGVTGGDELATRVNSHDVLGNSGTSLAIRFDRGAYDSKQITLNGSPTFTFTAPVSPRILTLVLTNDGTGGYTVTWPTITWKKGTPLQPNATASATSIFQFYYDGTNYHEVSVNNSTYLEFIEPSTAGLGAPNVLLGTESAKVLTNEGTTAANYHTLPTAVAGLTYTFVVQDADGLRITAASGDTIRLGPNVTATAGYIESTTIGDVVTATAINATEWVGHAYGTWTNGTWSYAVADTP